MKSNDAVISMIVFIVAVVGTVVAFGWFLKIPILTTVLPNAPSMKFTTAVCFLCSALIIFLIHQSLKGHYNLALTFLIAPCLVIALLIFFILVSLILGIQTGIENLFIKDELNAPMTVYPGRPSIGTMLSFILVLTAGVMTMINPAKIKNFLIFLGWCIAVIGIFAMLGYVLTIPALYYAFENISTAMAIHTAGIFVLIGFAFIALGRQSK